jgi:hypothetical protein
VPVTFGILDTGPVLNRRAVRWGTFGFGRGIRIAMETIDA